jgi:enamine deaminase RidA (YjgF/YER057c/UK114 family)
MERRMPTDSDIMAKLAELGHTLPKPATPVGEFLLWRHEGKLVFLAGQICERDGTPWPTGVYGAGVDLETARRGGLNTGLSLLANLRLALGGDLGRVRKVVMVRGFVTCAPGMGDYPKVINACSELFIALWGEDGRHARTSIGVAQLPLDATVEIDAVFAVD